MALTPSNMLPLGTAAPSFALPEPATGRQVTLEQVRGVQGTLVMFLCNHCPYVQHVNAGLVALGRDAQARGIGVAAISSNDLQRYPQDGPTEMARVAREQGYPFPYLFDASQAVARAYDAACTPDFYLFDAALRLVYRGRLDDSTPGNGRPVTGDDLRAAVDALLAGRPVPAAQSPSLGCNIKWIASGT